LIEIEGVRRWFGDRLVLDGVDLEVRPGEVFALLGRNGAGKTTLLNVLLGFLRPNAGSARLLGCDSRELTPGVRERVGLVSEGQRLYEWMRVRDVLDFEQGTRERFRRERADRLIEHLGLAPEQPVRRLSRGQRAQLALALAVSGDPDVLVLDDPAMGLDPVVRRELLSALIDLLGEEGRSVLFSTHVLSDVERIADRVGILHGGRLVVDAPLDLLRARLQKRFLRTEADLSSTPGVLRARAREGGRELLILDCEGEREDALRELGHLSDPVPVDLEEVFLDLTTSESEPALAWAGEVAR
jgi:ABC-2 type transport system ATP-binding protein